MATLTDIANAMFNFEGSSVNDLNHRNNNPGNLIYVGQAGAVLGEGGFAKFPTWDDGVAASINQLNKNLTRGTDAVGRPITTLTEVINSWANNPTPNYISSVSTATGIDPNANLVQQLQNGGTLSYSALDNNSPSDFFTGDFSAIGSDFSSPWIWGSALGLLALVFLIKSRE